MSCTIVPFLRGGSFDPETTRVMGRAYDTVRTTLHDTGQPLVVEEVIAARVIDIAKTGERDPDTICQRALTALGLERGM
jgi:hypothetical protein